MNDYASRLTLLRPTYEFHDKKSLIIETTKPGAEPRQLVDPLNAKVVNTLLLAFLKVEDTDTLMKYAERFDLPARSESHSKVVTSPLTSKQQLVVWRSVDYYLRLAAMLRWLDVVVSAVKQADHRLLESWITDDWRPVRKGNLFESSTEVMVDLILEPKPDSPERKDWELGKELLAKRRPFRISPSKWHKSNVKQRLDCAAAYLADQINALVAGISPTISPEGEQSFTITEPVQAMYLRLYDQLAGASGIMRCPNPNCATKFFLPKGKNGRKARSDRRYCDNSACQRWCYDNIGRVRTAKSSA